MKLIASLTSPYVRKVRICLIEKKIDVSLELVDAWDPNTPLIKSNPLSKVPCLVMDDGGAMFDSRVIAEYVDSLSPVGKLIPGAGKDRAAIKTWEALADGILDAAILARMEVAWAPRVNAGKVSDAWIERQIEKITRALAVAAKGLGSNAWCHGNQYSLADIALGCALGYLLFRFPDIKWQAAHPNLAKHYEKLAKRSAFKETLPPA